MGNTCFMKDCDDPPVGRGLCSAHYQRAKRAGRLDEIAPNPSASCERCGQPIPPGRRWGAIFCSPRCKEAAPVVRRSVQLLEEKAGRLCKRCSEPLSSKRSRGTLFCSKSCGYAWHDSQRRQAMLAAKANRDPCALCAGPVPVTRVSNAIYCSPACCKKAQDARWRAKAAGYMRQYLYGLSDEQYWALLASQDSRCAICGTDDWNGKTKKPHIDHDHVSRRVRGLLCDFCNRGLGMFRDDPARLRAAAGYLERETVCAD